MIKSAEYSDLTHSATGATQSNYDKYAEIENSDIEILNKLVYGIIKLLWDREIHFRR